MYPLLVEYFRSSSAGLGGNKEQILRDGTGSTRGAVEAVDRSLDLKFVIGFVDSIPLLFITFTGLLTGFKRVIAFKSIRSRLNTEPI